MKRIALMAGVAATAIMFTAPTFAQETTSSLRGKIVSVSGEPLANVEVVITHVPSGSRSTISTNSSGVFYARGLAVGGPYHVKLADGSEFTATDIDDLYLQLGQSSTVNITARIGGDMEEIVATGQRVSSSIKTGASSLYGRTDLDDMPSIGRDIKSVLQQDPTIWIDATNSNAMSIAGTNNRMNSITVDGIRQNDDFGLNGNGYPTQRSPVSLDAIEQVAVQTAPFDVNYGNFQGGNINIVTKSGTNEFHGGAFFEYSDDSFVGSKSKGETYDSSAFEEKTYGVTLGGPIIKDKLFFFASYEKYESTRPFEFGPEGSGAANEISGVTQADLDRVQSISQSVYGFDAMGFGGVKLNENDEKILLKLDWNINDDHRMTATYQRTDGNVVRPQNTGTWGDAGMLSDWYNKNDFLETYSAQVFSNWSDALSTELKIGFKNVDTKQEPFGGNQFALMEIATEGGGAIFIGPDFFRHANALSNDTFQLKAKADYVIGDHLITAGFERDTLDVFNLFVPGSRGSYFFNSIDDFENQIADNLFYQNAYTNNSDDGAAEFKIGINTLYLQDRWEPTADLTVFAGLRYEWYDVGSAPRENANFLARNGFTNTENLDGKGIMLPRIGFNYTFDERTTVRGGAGLFAGGSPNVWLSNAFSNDGVIIDSTFVPGPIANVDGYNIPADVQAQLSSGDGNVNATDPNYDLPSVWKFNVAVDHSLNLGPLGDDWEVSLEAIWSRVKDAPYMYESRRTQVGTAPDGRPIYDVPGGYDLILDTTGQGKSDVYSLNLSKKWMTSHGDFAFRAGYTMMDVEDVNPGQSSTATSNYGKVSTSDRNNMLLATSDHQIGNRLTASLNYTKKFFGDNETKIMLFLSSRAGRPYSFTFDDNGWRTGSLDNLADVLDDNAAMFGGDRDFWRRDTQLLYVPTGADDPNVTYADGFDVAGFNQLITALDLDDFRGEIVDRNSHKSPRVTKLDIRFQQEIALKWVGEGHKLTAYFDMENLTNFLDNDWGRVSQYSFPYNLPLVKADLIADEDGNPVYQFNSFISDPSSRLRVFQQPSLWKMKFGIKYEF